MNDYYTASGNPVAQSRGASSVQRAEFNSVEDGFDKVPAPSSLWADKANYGVDTGAANAYIVTIASTYNTSYTDGMTLKVKALNANTGASTINVNSLGVKTIVRPDGTALQANDIVSGQVFQITYNSTSGKFQMSNAYGGPSGPTGTLAGNATAGINWLQGPNIASATTMDIWSAAQGNEMIVNGTTTTTGFSAAPQAGASRVLIANGAWPITHGANLLLPGSVSYTCTAGDIITVHAITTTQFRCEITRANGTPVVASGITLLDVKTASSSAQLDFTQYINSTYDEYIFEIVDLVPATNAVQLQMLTSTDGGSTWAAGTSYWYGVYVLNMSAGVDAILSSVGGAYIPLTTIGASGNATTDGVAGTVKLFAPAGTACYKKLTISTVSVSGSNAYTAEGGAVRAAAADIDAVRFLFSSGNIASGSIRMYGVRKS